MVIELYTIQLYNYNCIEIQTQYNTQHNNIIIRRTMSRRAGIERELASRADQRVLRWFGHVERMDDYRMARRVLMAEVSGVQVEGDRG